MKKIFAILAALLFAGCSNEVQNSLLPFALAGNESNPVVLELYDPDEENATRALHPALELDMSNWKSTSGSSIIRLTHGSDTQEFDLYYAADSGLTFSKRKIILPSSIERSNTKKYTIEIEGESADEEFHYYAKVTDVVFAKEDPLPVKIPLEYSCGYGSNNDNALNLTLEFYSDDWNLASLVDTYGATLSAYLVQQDGTYPFSLTVDSSWNTVSDDKKTITVSHSNGAGFYVLYFDLKNYTDKAGVKHNHYTLALECGNEIWYGAQMTASKRVVPVLAEEQTAATSAKAWELINSYLPKKEVDPDYGLNVAKSEDWGTIYDIYCDDFWFDTDKAAALDVYTELASSFMFPVINIYSKDSLYSISWVTTDTMSAFTYKRVLSFEGESLKVDATGCTNKILTVNRFTQESKNNICKFYFKGNAKVKYEAVESGVTSSFPGFCSVYLDTFADYTITETAFNSLTTDTAANANWFLYGDNMKYPQFVYDMNGNYQSDWKGGAKVPFYFIIKTE